jgi:hypothetical protein
MKEKSMEKAQPPSSRSTQTEQKMFSTAANSDEKRVGNYKNTHAA